MQIIIYYTYRMNDFFRQVARQKNKLTKTPIENLLH